MHSGTNVFDSLKRDYLTSIQNRLVVKTFLFPASFSISLICFVIYIGRSLFTFFSVTAIEKKRVNKVTSFKSLPIQFIQNVHTQNTSTLEPLISEYPMMLGTSTASRYIWFSSTKICLHIEQRLSYTQVFAMHFTAHHNSHVHKTQTSIFHIFGRIGCRTK